MLQNFKNLSPIENNIPINDSSLEIAYLDSLNIFESEIKTYSLAKNDQTISIQSYLKLTNNSLETLDRGFDPATDKLLWGTEYGPFIFNKETI